MNSKRRRRFITAVSMVLLLQAVSNYPVNLFLMMLLETVTRPFAALSFRPIIRLLPEVMYQHEPSQPVQQNDSQQPHGLKSKNWYFNTLKIFFSLVFPPQ